MAAQDRFALFLSGSLLIGALATTGSAPPTQAISQIARPPDLATKALVERVCSDCHKFSMVSAQRKTTEQWSANVERMIEMGAVLPDTEVPPVVTYLAENYGPVGIKKAVE